MPRTSPRDESTDASVAIKVEGVGKAFGAEPVLRNISLDVRAGELLALLGPSGSGKTTLLRIIAGLDYADTGRILFGQDDATALPVQKRAVGFVFQHYALFRHMTVADNVAYGLRVRPRSGRPAKAEITRRVADLLDLVRLGGFADRYPGQLSGGQRQRVALARALAVEPRVLLLDEPFGALDAKVRKELRRWLRDIHERTGQTTIFVTHDQDEALELADRVAILDGGRLEQVGTPDQVQASPASASVVTFLGDAVAIDGLVEDGRVSVGGRPVNVAARPGLSGPVRIYVRPWHLRIVDEPAHLTGKVVRAFRSQGRQRVEVMTDDGQVIVAETSDVAPVKAAASVSLAITDAFLFDGAPDEAR